MLILSLKILLSKSIVTNDFSTLYATLPPDKLSKRLCNVIDFVFEGGNRTHICVSKNNVAYWGKKSKDNVAFSKSYLTSYAKLLFYGW